ncbi:MAG: hypothetical protein F2796_07300, partial [Actinobacteria bacterium]|nr:hypothetical protein [Actinomycetota bacterium]
MEADARTRAARVIGVDLQTAVVVRALRVAQVRAVLLKGPALSALLYDPGELRSYCDIDLLVAERDTAAAGCVLQRLGYRPLVSDAALDGHRRVHAHEWTSAGGVSVDLHRTLPGATAAPEVVFRTLAAQTRTLSVGGEPIEMLEESAALVQVALHAAHHGPRSGNATQEVERAVRRHPEAAWLEAAALAAQIGAGHAFAAGLRRCSDGVALADRLG